MRVLKERDNTIDVRKLPYIEFPESDEEIESQKQTVYKGGESRYQSQVPLQNIKPKELLNLFPLVDKKKVPDIGSREDTKLVWE